MLGKARESSGDQALSISEEETFGKAVEPSLQGEIE
jgi:hypothetical protein